MRLLLILLVMAGQWAVPAAAEPGPIIAPAAAWIEQLPIPAPDPAAERQPLQTLLVTVQSRYGDTSEHYFEAATRIQNGQGLNAVGTIALPWQPDRGDLIVNKAHIIRDGQVIDLLGNGQTFTVLRRENSLESAVLTGILTAVLQAEGLAIGDVLNVAFTIREKKGALPLRGENLFALGPEITVRHLRYRQIWSEGGPMKWRATEAMGKPRLTKTRWGNELVLDLHSPKPPKAPAGAPARYRTPALLQLSEYREWTEISRLMAPLYASARTIAAESPLRAEIARIAAATPDPEKRTLAALRLVQEKIRYLAITLGDGGLVPAGADETWRRRFGDCKGKTATLLALLDGLEIEAEPVAVSNGLGAAVAERLPSVRAFDHVIVRARVNGRSLWLDGTRQVEEGPGDVTSPPFGFGLPLTAAGASLEAMPRTPPKRPLQEYEIVWDASKGLDQPVSASGRILFRGELAAMWRSYKDQQDDKEVRDELKGTVPSVPNEDIEIGAIESSAETDSFSFTFRANTRIGWTKDEETSAVRIKFNNDVIEWTPEFEREDGPASDAPFELEFPVYQISRETILLPKQGAGFKIEATSFDREIAGTRIARTVTMEGGKAVSVSTFLRLRNEISAADAAAAKPILAKLSDDEAYVRSPNDYPVGDPPAGKGVAAAGSRPRVTGITEGGD